MRIGIQISRFTWENEPHSIHNILANIVKTADTQGFSNVWVMDHFFQIHYVGNPEEPMLEAYTTLGFLAGLTRHVTLGALVTGVIYRNPALLVNAVTTLDVLSEGRAYLGIGAAWNEEESVALGFDFPPVKERFERLEETLKIALQMWEGNENPFQGKYYHLAHPMNYPRPISKPHPPILIGGGGEKKTLYLVAKFANACNLFARLGKDELIRKLDILKEHCQDVGRNYDEIEKTALDSVMEDFDPEEVIAECQALRDLGFTHIIFSMKNIQDLTPLNIFGEEIIPKVKLL